MAIRATPVALLVLVTVLTSNGAPAESSRRSASVDDKLWNKTSSQILCTENEEYQHEDFCCKNCEAGTHVRKHCSRGSEKGICEPCERNTFTEHSNGMLRCLQCASCRNDQEEVAPCRPTQDTRCQCKPGTFCVPEQACEVCKKCAKCKVDDEMVQSCTTTSNTICRKTDSPPAPTTPTSTTDNTVTTAIWIIAVILAVVAAVITCRCRKKIPLCRRTVNQTNSPDKVKIPVPSNNSQTVEEQQNTQNALREEPQQETQSSSERVPLKSSLDEEDKGLGDSLPNTTSSSQTSLPHDSPELYRQPKGKGSPTERLIPVKHLNGEDALKRSFDIFGEFLDVEIHNRFFRDLGLNGNVIKNAASSPGEKVYELLTAWMQREGRKSNINYLIDVLLQLNQRYSAESIIRKVTEEGLYKYDDQCS